MRRHSKDTRATLSEQEPPGDRNIGPMGAFSSFSAWYRENERSFETFSASSQSNEHNSKPSL